MGPPESPWQESLDGALAHTMDGWIVTVV